MLEINCFCKHKLSLVASRLNSHKVPIKKLDLLQIIKQSVRFFGSLRHYRMRSDNFSRLGLVVSSVTALKLWTSQRHVGFQGCITRMTQQWIIFTISDRSIEYNNIQSIYFSSKNITGSIMKLANYNISITELGW